MSDLALYGNRSDVREFAERLKLTLPGASKLSGGEVTALAQLSVAHNLDPFNGEAWMIPGSGLMVGIKGLRKAAQRQAQAENGSYWTDITRVEPEKYNAPKNAIVYECILRDSVTTQAWAKSVNAITTAGIPYKEAIEMLGKAPCKLGIGIATPEERSKMDIHQRARKRAEADAIKQRYQVDFGEQVAYSDEEPVQEYIETTVTEVATTPRPAEVVAAELGYDTQTQAQPTNGVRPYPPDVLFAKIEERSKVHATKVAPTRLRQAIASALDGIFDGDKTKRYELCKWLTGKASTKDIPDAYVHALSDWLGVNDYGQPPVADAMAEARAALGEALKASGQKELL